MALQIELPRELLEDALQLAIAKRERDAKASKNSIIKQAHEQELKTLEKGKATIQQVGTGK